MGILGTAVEAIGHIVFVIVGIGDATTADARGIFLGIIGAEIGAIERAIVVGIGVVASADALDL